MSTISASTTSTTAYKVTADTTGTLVLQTGATPTTAVTIGTDQNATFAGTVADVVGTLRPLVSGTAVASTSGTSINFTALPSWIKRITVIFNEVSTNSSSFRLVQLGTGATPTYTTSGYLATSSIIATTVNTTSSTAGHIIYQDNAAYVTSGHMVLTNISGNIWISSHVTKGATNLTAVGGGSVTLGAVLTAVRITTANGTDVFDAGSINLFWE